MSDEEPYRIPEAERTRTVWLDFSPKTQDELLKSVRAWIEQTGADQLVSYADVNRMFQRGAKKLGVPLLDIMGALELGGHITTCKGTRGATLIISAPFYKTLTGMQHVDPVGVAVAQYEAAQKK